MKNSKSSKKVISLIRCIVNAFNDKRVIENLKKLAKLFRLLNETLGISAVKPLPEEMVSDTGSKISYLKLLAAQKFTIYFTSVGKT